MATLYFSKHHHKRTLPDTNPVHFHRPRKMGTLVLPPGPSPPETDTRTYGIWGRKSSWTSTSNPNTAFHVRQCVFRTPGKMVEIISQGWNWKSFSYCCHCERQTPRGNLVRIHKCVPVPCKIASSLALLAMTRRGGLNKFFQKFQDFGFW